VAAPQLLARVYHIIMSGIVRDGRAPALPAARRGLLPAGWPLDLCRYGWSFATPQPKRCGRRQVLARRPATSFWSASSWPWPNRLDKFSEASILMLLR